MGEINSSTVMRTIDDLKNASPEFIKDTLTRGCVKTGIFKRRMIHVARRFGALKKYVDFSNVSLRSLVKSFEGTIIYEEALKEVFAKDLDPDKLIEVFKRIKTSEIELVQMEARNEPSPVARVGVERVSMKTDLIPPEKMRRILLEAAKARLLDEARTFVCTNCWNYAEMLIMKDLPEKPTCPKCDSVNLGVLSVPEEEVFSLIDKKGEKLTQHEHKLRNRALATAKLVSNYGKPAAVAFSARRLKVDDVQEILEKQKTLSDEFYDLVIDAERNALKRKFL
jgi:ATP-dependent Lhr-like helicase